MKGKIRYSQIRKTENFSEVELIPKNGYRKFLKQTKKTIKTITEKGNLEHREGKKDNRNNKNMGRYNRLSS